jgi:type VI secretion system secreted protein VgrG
MSEWLTQEGRFLQLTTPLGEDVLTPIEFSATEELSQLFIFHLSMVSNNPEITAEQLIGKAITVELHVNQDDEPRYFHGIVNQFCVNSIENNIHHYSVVITPWLHLLHYTADCRIFQNKTVIDIAKTIFAELGQQNFDTTGLTKSYSKREYCVQYRETAFSFLQRLLQEEGIFYFFKHSVNKHILVLTDKLSVLPSCEDSVSCSTGSQKEDGLTQWFSAHAFYSGSYAQTDYNYQQPGTSLYTQRTSKPKLSATQPYTLYDYPGRYQDTQQGKQYAQQHFQNHELEYDRREGAGSYVSFAAGKKFTFINAPSANDDKDYALIAVHHSAYDKSYLGGAAGNSQGYLNTFSCLPANVPFAPAQDIPKPIIHGAQTAKVVGPQGEELYTDQYGRVKVQFHWDRKGQSSEHSSCWVRVGQLWAGNGWGALFMPRIGQEVIIQFLEGNPDRPIIVGSVYNGDNATPYALPVEQTRSGIKSHSTKGGGANDANELRFEDKSGSEEIYLHAQKDYNIIVQNSETRTIVQGDQTTTVQTGNQTTSISAGSSLTEAAETIQLQVGSNSLIINTQGVFINGAIVKVNQS